MTTPQFRTHSRRALLAGTGAAVVNGPAASPLAPVSIKVRGTSIVQA
jgi:hypothetical protein